MCIRMGGPPLSRRAALKLIAGATTGLPLLRLEGDVSAAGVYQEGGRATTLSRAEPPASLTADDEEFLDELERATFLFFLEQTNPDTGIVRDRFNVRSPDKS